MFFGVRPSPRPVIESLRIDGERSTPISDARELLAAYSLALGVWHGKLGFNQIQAISLPSSIEVLFAAETIALCAWQSVLLHLSRASGNPSCGVTSSSSEEYLVDGLLFGLLVSHQITETKPGAGDKAQVLRTAPEKKSKALSGA